MGKKRIGRLLLCFIISISMIFGNMGMAAYAAEGDGSETAAEPRIELKINDGGFQELEAGETFTAEVWLYNVENVTTGSIHVKGQTFDYDKTVWNSEIGLDSSQNSFSKGIIKFGFESDTGKTVGTEGVKLVEITCKMDSQGVPSLSFGGALPAFANSVCTIKTTSELKYVNNGRGEPNISASITYSPTIELRVNSDKNKALNENETYTAEVWLHNVVNVTTGSINVKGQTFDYDKTVWNSEIGLDSSQNSFSKGIIKFGFESDTGKTVGTEGVKLVEITCKMDSQGVPLLSFGGALPALANSVCTIKTTSELKYVNNGRGEPNISSCISYSANSEGEPGPEYDVWTSSWPSFRGNSQNMGVTNAATPVSNATTALKWTSKQGSGYTANIGPALLIGDYLYATTSTELLRINKETGIAEKSVPLNGSTLYNTVSPTYGVIGEEGKEKGVIFIALSGGSIQAVEATTMTTLWTSQSLGSGQNQCPTLYDDEKQLVYSGFWSSESDNNAYICLDANTGKQKWKHEHRGGFYWAGAVVIGNYLVVGSDNGDDGSGNGGGNSDHDLSTLYVLNKETGQVIDSTKTLDGDQRSTIAYDKTSNKIYFTTKGGYLYSAGITEQGKIENLQGKMYQEGLESTSTPVVYKGRVYVGIGTLNSKRSCVIVADAANLEEIYRVPMEGYPQGSGLLSTAYEDKTGEVYLYFTYNRPPGGVTLIKDKPGQTEANKEELYVPGEGLQEYCLSSVICDTDGTLYYLNDSGTLFALEKNEAYLNRLSLRDDSDKEIELVKQKNNNSNNGFAPGYLSYYATVEPTASSVTFDFDVPEGAVVSAKNGSISGNQCEVQLTDDKTDVELTVTKGSYSRTYTIHVQKASVDTSLRLLGITTNGNHYDFSQNEEEDSAFDITPLLAPGVNEYTFGFENCSQNDARLHICIMPQNQYANVKIQIKDKSKIQDADKVLDKDDFFTGTNKEYGLWKDNSGKQETCRCTVTTFILSNDIKEDDIELVATVTAEDGKTTQGYKLTVKIDRVDPEITNVKWSKLSSGGKKVAFNSSEEGKVEYILKNKGDAAPTIMEFLTVEESLPVSAGRNEIEIPTAADDQEIYILITDESGNWSKICKAEESANAPVITEDKITVSFRLIGSTQAKGSVDLSKGQAGYQGAEYVTWIKTDTYTLDKGATVYDLFKLATTKAGLNSVGAENGYVKTITAPAACGGYDLSEFTNGNRSGWMYTVDGSHPKVSLTDCELKNGQSVVWHYVNDYSYEVRDWNQIGGSGYPSLGDGTFYDRWLTASDTTPSGGNPAEQTQPVTQDTTATINKDGEATSKVTSADVDKLVDAAVKQSATTIEVNVKGADKSDKVTLELPKASVSNIANKTDAALQITTPQGIVTMDKQAMKEAVKAASGSDLTIALDKQEIADASKEPLGSTAAQTKVSILSGGKEIKDLGTAKVKILLPVSDAVKDKAMAAAAVDEDGKLTKTEGKLVTVNGKTYYQIETSKPGTFVVAESANIDAAVKAQAAETDDEKLARIKKGVQNTTIKITKTSKGKGWIQIKWKKSKGYKVDYYEVFRKTGKNSKFGKKAFYKTKKHGMTGSYKNTKALKKGKRYYYKVRGVRVIDGKKYYTKWSRAYYRIAK